MGQEKTHNVPKCILFVPEKPQIILGKDKGFTFDYVFQPSATQVGQPCYGISLIFYITTSKL